MQGAHAETLMVDRSIGSITYRIVVEWRTNHKSTSGVGIAIPLLRGRGLGANPRGSRGKPCIADVVGNEAVGTGQHALTYLKYRHLDGALHRAEAILQQPCQILDKLNSNSTIHHFVQIPRYIHTMTTETLTVMAPMMAPAAKREPLPRVLPFVDIPTSSLTALCHPEVDAVTKEVDDYFLQHWPFPDARSRKKFVNAGFSRVTCLYFPMSLDDRIHFACRLLTVLFLIDGMNPLSP